MTLIHENYSDALFGLIVRIVGNENHAKEVLQDCLVKYWEKAHTYDPKKAKLFTWLYRIARNKAIDFIRVERKDWMADIQTPPDIVNNKEERQAELLDMHDHLNELDPKYAMVVNAIVMQGYTHQEASEKFDIPLGTLKTRLKIGLRELKKKYADVIVLLMLLWQ